MTKKTNAGDHHGGHQRLGGCHHRPPGLRGINRRNNTARTGTQVRRRRHRVYFGHRGIKRPARRRPQLRRRHHRRIKRPARRIWIRRRESCFYPSRPATKGSQRAGWQPVITEGWFGVAMRRLWVESLALWSCSRLMVCSCLAKFLWYCRAPRRTSSLACRAFTSGENAALAEGWKTESIRQRWILGTWPELAQIGGWTQERLFGISPRWKSVSPSWPALAAGRRRSAI